MTWRTWVGMPLGVGILVQALMAGCLSSDSSPPQLSSNLQGIAGRPVVVPPDQFLIPYPRIGDVVSYDVRYEYEEGDFVHKFSAEERLHLLAPRDYVDGYGERRSAYLLNVTYFEDGANVDQYDVWVDLATNQQTRQMQGAFDADATFSSDVLGLGLYETRRGIQSTGRIEIDYNRANFLSFAGVHGGLAQGRLLPKQGGWSWFNAAIDAAFNLHASPTEASAPTGMVPQGTLEAYALTAQGETPDAYQVHYRAVISPTLAYPLDAELVFSRPAAEDDPAVNERYALQLKSLVPGTEPLQAGQEELLPRARLAGEALGTSFPLGGPTFLPFTPEEGRAAAVLLDPDIAAWFSANPDAFLSFAVYAFFDAHDVAGMLSHVLSQDQYEQVKGCVWYLEYTNPANGQSLGFETSAYVTPAGASPPVYEKYPWYNAQILDPTSPNYYPFTRNEWIQDRTHVAPFTTALAHFEETAGPQIDEDPNLIVFFTYGTSDGGRGGYFLDDRADLTTRDYVAATGVGIRVPWDVHFTLTDLDGFRTLVGDYSLLTNENSTFAGVPIPFP